MTKIEKVEKYINDFFSERWGNIDIFYRATYQQRTWGIYRLKTGSELMGFLIGVHDNIKDNLRFQYLIPHKFSTSDRLFAYLNNFQEYLNEHQYLLDVNLEEGNTDYIVAQTQEIKDDLVDMIDYVKHLYDLEDSSIPYQDLRYNLMTRNIPRFIIILKSVLASISYAITKVQEGYFHSNVHLILKLLGFDILSEELTNNGRIDAVIRFSDMVYIVEFKFDNVEDKSKIALQQIRDKKYVEKFLLEHKDIIGIGISFSKNDRNINGFDFEKLNK